ncbi:MAG: prolipoprotein diacylglyceryl transferase [Salinivirgaceae bacterium]|nr:prolipoprotein diacylglyceryl transferase [Salinivirgaceae bacterium]
MSQNDIGMLGHIVWDMNPEIFSIGFISVRWYGLLFAASFFFGYIVMLKYFKIDGLSIKVLDSVSMYMFIGVVIGARLGHCLFYELDYYLSNPLEILKIYNGGLASHGAAVGIFVALYLFSRKNKIPYLNILDRMAIVVALSGFFIRMGNFFNSEIYGVATSKPWGVIFVRAHETVAKHPTQIYEALVALLLFFVLHTMFMKWNKRLVNGVIFSILLIVLFLNRFLIEFIKEVQVDFETTMSLNMGQWLSIPLILTGVVILVSLYSQNKGFLRPSINKK